MDLKTKSVVLLASTLFRISSVLGAGYREAFEVVASPESYSQATIFYEGLSLQLGLLAFGPVAVVFVLGAWYDYWDDREYWKMLVVAAVAAFFAVILFPFMLLYL